MSSFQWNRLVSLWRTSLQRLLPLLPFHQLGPDSAPTENSWIFSFYFTVGGIGPLVAENQPWPHRSLLARIQFGAKFIITHGRFAVSTLKRLQVLQNWKASPLKNQDLGRCCGTGTALWCWRTCWPRLLVRSRQAGGPVCVGGVWKRCSLRHCPAKSLPWGAALGTAGELGRLKIKNCWSIAGHSATVCCGWHLLS